MRRSEKRQWEEEGSRKSRVMRRGMKTKTKRRRRRRNTLWRRPKGKSKRRYQGC